MCLLLRYNERNKYLKEKKKTRKKNKIIQCFHCAYTLNSRAPATETTTANKTTLRTPYNNICRYCIGCLTVCFSQRLDIVRIGRFVNFIVVRLNSRNCAFVSYILKTVAFNRLLLEKEAGFVSEVCCDRRRFIYGLGFI